MAALGILMHLDHANIVTSDLDMIVRFFTDVLGFTTGPRPNFRTPGHWLYSEGRPLIHLSQATGGLPTASVSPRIDHIALRIANLDEWSALLDRLKAHGIEYQLSAPNDGSDLQLWVSPAAGVTIEFIITPASRPQKCEHR
ncbi:VOC family protein [Pseudomonas sp. NA-150]|uniref:VOC family protein n=1 Tax=Pseudomonas sp. NA-150 TaxID=3367525 RepID=UPI0037C76746